MNNKMEELLGMTKLADFLSKRADEEKKSRFLWIMAIIGAVAAIAVAAYFIYKFFAPDYMDDFEDDFEDEFEEDFFDDEDEEEYEDEEE